MKRTLRITAMSLALVILFCAPTAAISEIRFSLPYDSAQLTLSQDAAYLLCAAANRLYIERVCPDSCSFVLTLDYPVSRYALFGDRVSILCDDAANNQVIAYWYSMSTDSLWSAALANISLGDSPSFGFDGDQLYLFDPDRNSVILCYDSNGSRTAGIELSRRITQVITSPDGVTYAVAGGSLYKLIGSRCHPLSNHTVSTPIRFVADDVIADSSGALYRLSGSSAYAYTGYPAPATIVGNQAYFAEDTILYAGGIGEDADRKFVLDGRIGEVCAVDGCIVALYYDGQPTVSCVGDSDFSVMRHDTAEEAILPPELPGDYRFDYDAGVCIVPANTTVAALKQSLKNAGYSPRCFHNDVEITSGKLKTGMTIIFGSYSHEICIKGDITGEGNVNKRDLERLMDVLLGVYYVSGVYFDAGDINEDGILDTLDLILLLDTVNGK